MNNEYDKLYKQRQYCMSKSRSARKFKIGDTMYFKRGNTQVEILENPELSVVVVKIIACTNSKYKIGDIIVTPRSLLVDKYEGFK